MPVTSIDGPSEIRRAVAGADRAFTVVKDDNKGGGNPPAPTGDDCAPPCPIVALGHLRGTFYFLDRVGQQVDLSARSLGNRHDLLNKLFGGDDAWLRHTYPKKAKVARRENGVEVKDEGGNVIHDEKTVDFVINRASAALAKLCFDAGLWGEHIVLRRPGVWPDESGAGAARIPCVHCGDRVLIGATWHKAGYRIGNTIWSAAAALPRPGPSCDSSIGADLQSDIQRLWKFREGKEGGAIVVMGLLGTAYYGGAARWRSCGFLVGQSGCGKTKLLDVMAACCPMHWYKNDTSKSGWEQGLNGVAMPSFIDENEKSGGRSTAALELLDLVLTATQGSGTRGARGDINGAGRSFQVVTSVMMAATAAPEMRETHLGRIAIIELDKPSQGEDNKAQHDALIEKMKGLAAGLWGRALASWERYCRSLDIFRTALAAEGCAPREMDQLGAILAGWWVLVREGDPNPRGALEGVHALAGFVRTAEIVAEDSNSRRLVQYLMTKAIMLDRSSARESIGSLIGRIIAGNGIAVDASELYGTDTARRALGTHGIRVIRADEPPDRISGRPAPCLSMNGGVWLNPRATELAALFEGSDWAASRWVSGLLEMPRCKRSVAAVRVGGVAVKAIWMPLDELQLTEDRQPGSDPPEV